MIKVNINEGVEQAAAFAEQLEKIATEAGLGGLSAEKVVKSLEVDYEGYVSLQALGLFRCAVHGDNEIATKLAQVGIVLGILYEKKVQAEKAKTAAVAAGGEVDKDTLATDARNYQ